jgi:hypothetical protein
MIEDEFEEFFFNEFNQLFICGVLNYAGAGWG